MVNKYRKKKFGCRTVLEGFRIGILRPDPDPTFSLSWIRIQPHSQSGSCIQGVIVDTIGEWHFDGTHHSLSHAPPPAGCRGSWSSSAASAGPKSGQVNEGKTM